ncbi:MULTISPECIES: hypothetical protein [Pseudomonas fluorescens group]|uniref:hypothetical protein n=1 Tax=Pseudomonas fluorescens group TaxID=136843 RepID=UPI0012EC5943|nr:MULTISPECIES: hypothetical protein [Pseudomonas fluorescens group]
MKISKPLRSMSSRILCEPVWWRASGTTRCGTQSGFEDQKIAAFGSSYGCTVFQMQELPKAAIFYFENAALCAGRTPCEPVWWRAWGITQFGFEDQKIAAFGSSYGCTVFQM